MITLTAKPSKRSALQHLAIPVDQTFDSAINTSNTHLTEHRSINNQGIDIQAFDLGTTGYNILEPEEDSIRFNFHLIKIHTGHR